MIASMHLSSKKSFELFFLQLRLYLGSFDYASRLDSFLFCSPHCHWKDCASPTWHLHAACIQPRGSPAPQLPTTPEDGELHDSFLHTPGNQTVPSHTTVSQEIQGHDNHIQSAISAAKATSLSAQRHPSPNQAHPAQTCSTHSSAVSTR